MSGFPITGSIFVNGGTVTGVDLFVTNVGTFDLIGLQGTFSPTDYGLILKQTSDPDYTRTLFLISPTSCSMAAEP
jgi:hypothetical protein